MLHVRPMDRHTFPAFAVISASHCARAMISARIRFPEFLDKFILQPVSFILVSQMKLGHRVLLLLIAVYLHNKTSLGIDASFVVRFGRYYIIIIGNIQCTDGPII